MSRLTKRNYPNRRLTELRKNGLLKIDMSYSHVEAITNKLAHYEDLEEQGRLIEVVYGFDKSDYPSAFECSMCGFCDWDTYTADDGVYNYCPRCGAKIEELKGE